MAITLDGSNGATTSTTPLASDITQSGTYFIHNAVYDTGWTYDVSNASVAHHVGTNTTAPVRIRSNNIDGIVVDSAGRVAMPYQPAFRARVGSVFTGSGSAGGNELFPFTVAEVNTGNNYNTSTSTFTAPVDGTYNFSWWASASSSGVNSRYFRLRLNVNGVYILNPHNTISDEASNADYNIVGASAVVSLSAGDTVNITFGTHVASNNFNFYSDMCFFSGYLIG